MGNKFTVNPILTTRYPIPTTRYPNTENGETTMNKQKIKNIKSFFYMTFGVILLTIGVFFFKIPNGFVTGGVSGIGTLFGNIFPFLSAASWISIINAILSENKSLIVSPKDIDKLIEKNSKIIANGINLSLHKNIDFDFIENYIS